MIRRILLGLALLIGLAALAIYWFLSGDGIRTSLERQGAAWLGQPVRIGSARAQLFPRVAIQLGDIRIGDPVRLSLADVEVSTGLRPLLSRRVVGAELIIANSRIELPLPITIPHGDDAPAVDEGGTGITIESVRAIRLRDIRIVSRGREIVVSAESALNGTQLDLSSFTAHAGRTAIEASGVVELEPALNVRLQASANELDLDDLVALANAFTPPAQTRRVTTSKGATGTALVGGRVTAKITAPTARAAGVELSNLATSLVAQGSRVSLSNTSFELFGGKYHGGLDVDAGDTLGITLTSRIEGLDVARLAAFGGVEGAITGALSGTGRFIGRGGDFASVLASASGRGSAELAGGTIRGLDLVRTVILFFGRPAADAPESGGDRFNRMTADFSLTRQVVTASAFELNAPDVDVMGTGTLTIPTKALHGQASLILSESLSAQAGTDLVRYTREGNRVVLPATIGGSLGSPRVVIDAAAAVKRGLRNEAERQLKSLFDRLKPPQP